MARRILITSTDLMMVQFLMPHVVNLSRHGFEVEIACSDVGGRMNEIQAELKEYVEAIHTVRLVRSPFSFVNLKGYQDMKNVIRVGCYDRIWTNEPVMGVVTRLAARTARRNRAKVMYMAHGFHFYSGAPLKNWLLYYPVEWLCSWLTDTLVTINREDYRRAKRWMHAVDTEYIPGIGIDMKRFWTGAVDIGKKRAELGLQNEDIMLLSVGELSGRKNHKAVIRALHELKSPHVRYFICGKGKLRASLTRLTHNLGMDRQVKLLGYRSDIPELCRAADLFILPSHQEGVPVALMEAIACQLPVTCSRIRGNVDIVEDFLFDENDVQDIVRVLKRIVTTRSGVQEVMKESVHKNYRRLERYGLSLVSEKILGLCGECD